MWTKKKFSFDWLTYFLVVSYISVFTDKKTKDAVHLKIFFGNFGRNLKGAWEVVKRAKN